MGTSPISKIIRGISKVTFYSSSAFLVVIMFLVTIDVTGRAFFDTPLLGTLELCEFMLACAIMLGLAHTQHVGGNVMVELLYERLPARMQKAMSILSLAVGIVIFVLMTWQGGVYAYTNWEADLTSDILKIPAWPALSSVPVGAALMTVELVMELMENLHNSVAEGK